MIDIGTIQRYLPASVKNTLKPYYRKLLPNQLCVSLLVTLRCNYRCSYCPWVTKFAYSKIYKKEKELTPEAWIRALDKLPKANIYISGGEPFLFHGLPELINELKKHKILGIVTNASLDTVIYKRIAKKVHLNISFHREFISEEKFIKKIDELRKIGRFHLNINIVAIRENVSIIPKLKKLLTAHDVSLHIDPFVDPDMMFQYTSEEKAILSRYLPSDRITKMNLEDFNSYNLKKCSAGQNYINIMPDGTVFRCLGGTEYYHSPLKKRLLRKGPNAPYDPGFFLLGNIFDSDFKLDKKPVHCQLPCTSGCDWDMANVKLFGGEVI